MTRRASPFVSIAGLAAILLAGVAAGCGILRGGGGRPAGDDDRSQIIVRGGSAIFEDGTGSNAHRWMGGNPNDPKDKKKWKPDQSNGASVSAYSVTVQQPAQADGTPSTPCPTLPLVGKAVTIEYTRTVNPPAAEQFTLSIVPANNGSDPRNEPLLSSTVDLEPITSIPSQLIYDPQTGWLSKVTIYATDPSGPSQSCSFKDPNGTSTDKAVIVIQPLK